MAENWCQLMVKNDEKECRILNSLSGCCIFQLEIDTAFLALYLILLVFNMLFQSTKNLSK